MGVGNPKLDVLSIVIPIYKKTQNLSFLKATIRQARNRLFPVEFILVQDGENVQLENELLSFARELNLVYAKVDNASPGLTRNKGIQIASAEWLAFWDCDDIGNVEAVLEAIEATSDEYNVLIGNYYIHDLKTNSLRYFQNKSNRLERLMISPGIWRFVFRKTLIGKIRFDGYRMGEDQLFLCKLELDSSSIKYVDKVFYTYNTNVADQLTSQPEAISDLVPAIHQLSSLTMDKTRKFSYIHVVQIKLIMTAIKNGEYSMRDVFDFLFKSKDRNSKFAINICIGLFKVLTALVFRRLRQ